MIQMTLKRSAEHPDIPNGQVLLRIAGIPGPHGEELEAYALFDDDDPKGFAMVLTAMAAATRRAVGLDKPYDPATDPMLQKREDERHAPLFRAIARL